MQASEEGCSRGVSFQHDVVDEAGCADADSACENGRIEVGGLEVVGELELPDTFGGAPPADLLDDAALAARWRVSRRTLARLRDQRRIPYSQPTPKSYLYRLTDIEAVEAASRVDSSGRVRVARAK